jgi:hypothetical protein
MRKKNINNIHAADTLENFSSFFPFDEKSLTIFVFHENLLIRFDEKKERLLLC